MHSDLSRCPFCGGEAEQRNPDAPHGGMVNCRSCGAEAFGPKWNARPAEAASALNDLQRLGQEFDARPLPSREAVARVLKDELRLIWFYADEPDAAIDEQSIEEATTAILDLFKETSNV